ncbi:MAG: hypothetical protein J0I06_20725 [Planctomycetes bacterium]|nr:hypothetical protein [Planctomycetota bacterium]
MCPVRIPLSLLLTVSTAAGRSAAADPAAGAPPVGTVQTLPVLSVSLAVGSTGRETKRAVYAPPPGWYVRSHRVVVTNKYGSVAYAVSTVPAGWDWRADEEAASAGRSNTAGTVSAYKVQGGGQLATSRELSAADHHAVASSHHLLVIDAAARGCGFLQSGSGVELTVVAEMVYLGR